MNIKSKMKLLFKSIFAQFGAVTVDEGMQLIWNEDGELAEGYEIFIEQTVEGSEEIEYVPAPDGEYHADGKLIVIKDGKVEKLGEGEPAEKPAEEMNNENNENKFEGEGGEGEGLTPESITAPEEPGFDAEDAYRNLLEKYDAMAVELQALKDQIASLMGAPAEENAFEKQNKVEQEEEKKLLFRIRK